MADRWGQFDNDLSGGSDKWDDGLVGSILLADYFEAAAPVEITGGASGTIGLTGTSTATVAVGAGTAGLLDLTGAGAGIVRDQVTEASGSISLDGSAAGRVEVAGNTNGAIALIGGAAAAVSVTGVAAGAIEVVGTMVARIVANGVTPEDRTLSAGVAQREKGVLSQRLLAGKFRASAISAGNPNRILSAQAAKRRLG